MEVVGLQLETCSNRLTMQLTNTCVRVVYKPLNTGKKIVVHTLIQRNDRFKDAGDRQYPENAAEMRLRGLTLLENERRGAKKDKIRS